MASSYQCADCPAKCDKSAVMELNCGKHSVCKSKCFPNRFQRPGVKGDVLFCSICPDTSRGIFIFVDDSNIWIGAKTLQSRLKCHKTVEDHRIRIDIGRLTDVLAGGRPVSQGVLYGSEPPPVDTVWTKIEERGWRVMKDKKHSLTGKEKKVDTRLVAEVTRLAIDTPTAKRTTIVLVTGDADVIPAIQEVMREDCWKVEVYMWRHTMSQDLPRFASANSKRVLIKPLNDFLSKVSFTNMRFDISRPKFFHFVKKGGVVFTIDSRAFHWRGDFHKRIPTQSWLNKLESIAQWPFQYYWFDCHEHGKTNHLVVVFRPDSKAGDFDIRQFLVDIEVDVGSETKRYRLPSTATVQPFFTFIQNTYKKHSDGDKEICKFDDVLEQVGNYSDEEALAGSDNEVVYEADSQKEWQTYRRKPHSYGHLRQQYSKPCQFKYNCSFGTKCQYQHSEDEKAYFRGRPRGGGNPVRKVSLCIYFKQGTCRHMTKKKDCDFAHGSEDAWCLDCRITGHFTDHCPKQLHKASCRSP